MRDRDQKTHGREVRAEQALNMWDSELSVQGVSSATLRAYRIHTSGILDDVAAHLGRNRTEIDLTDLTREVLVAAVVAYQNRVDGRSGKTKPKSPASVALRLASVRTWLTWCVDTDKVLRNEAARIRPPKARPKIPRGLSSSECDLLVAEARQSRWKERDELVLLLGLTLGLRLSEIAGLELGSFQPSAEAALQVRVLGKGSKERILPVPRNLADALGRYLPTRTERLRTWGTDTEVLLLSSRRRHVDGEVLTELSASGVAEIHERLLHATGLKRPGRRCHSSRHAWATIGLAGRSHDVEQLRSALGHSSSATTGRYLSTDSSALQKAADAHPLSRLGQEEPQTRKSSKRKSSN